MWRQEKREMRRKTPDSRQEKNSNKHKQEGNGNVQEKRRRENNKRDIAKEGMKKRKGMKGVRIDKEEWKSYNV